MKKITELPAASSVDSSDTVVLVQAGTTKKALVSQLATHGGSVGDLMVHGPDGTLVPHVDGKATIEATEVEAKGNPYVTITSKSGSFVTTNNDGAWIPIIDFTVAPSPDTIVCDVYLTATAMPIAADGYKPRYARFHLTAIFHDEMVASEAGVDLNPLIGGGLEGISAELSTDSLFLLGLPGVRISWGWETRIQYQRFEAP